MCARRFLIAIFVMTLLVVAGAFAIFQWGGRMLVSQATPKGHFQAAAAGAGPDYALISNWLDHPDLRRSPSLWRPDNDEPPPDAEAQAAIFYVHPTTYLERDRWNAPICDGEECGEAGRKAEIFVQSQASAFSGLGPVWAPRYRQAAFGAFLLKSDDANKALDLAYADVGAAFDEFLRRNPQGPVILAGHSQGSLHLLRLLADRKDALKGRLVAAYVVGWPVGIQSDLPATGLGPCQEPAQAGCVLSWQSFAEPANPSLIAGAWVGTRGLAGIKHVRDDMLCVDPVSGLMNGKSQPADNPGTLVPSLDMATASLAAGQVGARCDHGFLMIGGAVPAMGPYVLPGNNYHVYDYALFWGAVRRDAARRLAAWR
jgi:hypothetical protein